jgi:L-ascorbate metabolism protein UlaG (beta-lactamase superfamily)
MIIKWYGHASFLIESEAGTRIITDPYQSGGFGGQLAYKPINEEAHVVLVSHEHLDHNYTAAVKGHPVIIKGPGLHRAREMDFTGVAAWHDTEAGSLRGENTVFAFSVDGVTFVHLGDLGHILTDDQIKALGKTGYDTGLRPVIDVMFVPVGGTFTIDHQAATQLVEKVKPLVTIPMHYRTPGCHFAIDGVDKFLAGKTNVKKLKVSELEFSRSLLPASPEIWVLQPAR